MEHESEENKQKALDILSKLDLIEKKEEHPLALSGGQKQRVAIATAMFLDKKYLFFDEPTSGLDFANMQKVGSILKDLVNDTNMIAVITHDKELIKECCDIEVNFDNGIRIFTVLEE
ncbi:MAG: ATP-binding cassette domain-containing protein [Eubacteriales bacterium]